MLQKLIGGCRTCCICCNCFRGMLQTYVSSVLDVPDVCFICVFWTHVTSVFFWMLHMLHTYVACVLFGCCVWLQWVSSVSEACFKCLNCLHTYVATVVFGCFKSRSGVASLLRTFYCIVSVCPPSGASRASIRCYGCVLPNRRRRAPPLLSLGRRGPCVEHAKQSASCKRPSGRPGR